MASVTLVANAQTVTFMVDLPVKDMPVLAAAVTAQAPVLLTGDVQHFGRLMARRDLPIQVMTIREFLLTYPVCG